ncbi:hypothetical protein GCM10019017_35250 [Streptomyces showdoensis]
MSGDLATRSAQVITRCDIRTGKRWSEGVAHYQELGPTSKLAVGRVRVIRDPAIARSGGPAYRGGRVHAFTSLDVTCVTQGTGLEERGLAIEVKRW